MPMTATGGERTAIAAASYAHFGRLEITDPDGAWRDVSTGLNGIDWLTSAAISESIDGNCLQLQATLAREAGSLSLAPLMTGSLVNRNAATAYAPMLDLHRQWRFSTAVIAFGATPITADWKQVGIGYIDKISDGGLPNTMTMLGRCLGARLLDAQIPVNTRIYSPLGTSSMEAVIQAMIDDQFGAGAITLYTPTATLIVMRQFVQGFANFQDAINAVCQQFGFVCRYRYDASQVYRLTLYKPARVPGAADWILGPAEYTDIPLADIDISGVRNAVELRYIRASDGSLQTVRSPTTFTSASITSYDLRYMAIDMQNGTQIFDNTSAQGMADAARTDLELPALVQKVVVRGFWPVQLHDYFQFNSNAVMYDTAQNGAVTAYTKTWENGQLNVTIDCAAKPKGGYATWRALGSIDINQPANLRVDVTPGSPNYTINWTGDNVQVTTDGGVTYASPPASPFTVARNVSGGADKIYTFRGRLGAQIVSNTVTIPAQSGSTPPALAITALLSNDQGDDKTFRVTITAQGTNLPAAYTWAIYQGYATGNYGVGAVQSGSNAVNPIGGAGFSFTVAPGPKQTKSYKLVITVGADTYVAYNDVQPFLRLQAVGGNAGGLLEESGSRGGSGGLDLSGQRYQTQPPYSADGFTPMWNPATKTFTGGGALFHPNGATFDDVETGGVRGKGGFTNTTGGLASTAADSNTRGITRLLAKTLVGDPDTLDGTPEGTTYKRVSNTAIDGSGNVDFSKVGVTNRYTGNIGRSSGDATLLSTIVGQIANTGHAGSGMQESGGKAINRLLGKTLAGDADSLDGTPEGITYKRVTVNAVDGSSNIDFSKSGFTNKNVDNVGDGSTYNRTLATAITSGQVDLSKAGVIQKYSGNITRSAGNATPISTIVGFLADTGHAGSTMQESGGKAINRLLGKTLAGDADTLDGTPEGTTFKRVIASAIDTSTSKIDFTKTGFLGKNADNLGRSAGDATGVSTIIARLANTGQPDGTMQATDGSVLAGGRTAKRAAGTGSGASDEDRMRGGGGGIALAGLRYVTDAPYTSDGFTPMWNPVTGTMTAAVKMPAGTQLDDTETRVTSAIESSGALQAATQQRSGTGLKNIAAGRYATGARSNAESFSYPANYQNPPAINILGGLSYEPASVWGSTAQADANTGLGALAPFAARQIDEVVAYNVTASGASLRGRLRQASTVTARTDTFAAGTFGSGGSMAVTLANAPSNDDRYTASYTYDFESSGIPGKTGSVSATVSLEHFNGSVWITDSTVTYSGSDIPSGGIIVSGSDTQVAVVSGLTNTSQLRLRCSAGAGTGSRIYTVDPGTVTYNTTAGDQYASKTPIIGGVDQGIRLNVEVIGAS